MKKPVVGNILVAGVGLVIAMGTAQILLRNRPEQEIVLARNKVDIALSRLKSLGVELDYSKLKRDIPVELNGAPLYRQAVESYLRLHLKDPVNYDVTPPAYDFNSIQKYVVAMEPVLAIVDKAVQRPYCVIAREFDASNIDYTPDSYYITVFQKAYIYRARLASRAGDFRAALKWVRKADLIVQQQSPPLNPQLELYVLYELEMEMQQFGTNPEFMAAVRPFVVRSRPLPSMIPAFPRLVAYARSRYEWRAKYPLPPAESDLSTDLQFRLGGLAKVLNGLAAALSAIKEASDDWRVSQESLSTMTNTFRHDSSPEGRWAYMYSDSLEFAGEEIGLVETHRNILTVAFNLYSETATTGNFPKALPPSAPEDPFRHGPFTYAQSGDSFDLSSVGPMRHDQSPHPPAPFKFAASWPR